MAPAGSRGPVGVDHFQPDTRAYRGHSFCSFSQWIWVTSDSVFLSWHLKNHLKPLLFLSLGSDEEEGRYRSGDEVVLDIILSFLQSFSVTQSFILSHFPRTITCRQLMEVQHTVVKSTGSWARQAISNSSKTILLKTLKIERKKNPENVGDFLLPFCDWSHQSSVWQSRLNQLVGSVQLGLLRLLALWAIPLIRSLWRVDAVTATSWLQIQRWASSLCMQRGSRECALAVISR